MLRRCLPLLFLSACTPAPAASVTPPPPFAAAPAARPPVGVPTVRAVVPLDRVPIGAATVQDRVLLAHADAGGLTALEVATGALSTLPLDGATPTLIEPFAQGNAALVADPAGQRVLVVDATGVRQSVALGDVPAAIAVGADGLSIAIGLATSGNVEVLTFGAALGQPPKRKTVPRGGGLAAGAALAFDGARVLAASPAGSGMRMFHAGNGQSADFAAASGPCALTFYYQGELKLPVALVPSAKGDGLAIANPSIPGGPLPVPLGGGVGRLAVFTPLDWVWATLPATQEVVAVNYISRQVMGRAAVGKGPGRMWFQKALPLEPSAVPAPPAAPAYRLLHGGGFKIPDLAYEAWVSNDDDTTVSVFDADGAVPGVTHLPAGAGRKHVAFAGTDAYVASEGAKTLTIIQRPSL